MSQSFSAQITAIMTLFYAAFMLVLMTLGMWYSRQSMVHASVPRWELLFLFIGLVLLRRFSISEPFAHGLFLLLAFHLVMFMIKAALLYNQSAWVIFKPKLRLHWPWYILYSIVFVIQLFPVLFG